MQRRSLQSYSVPDRLKLPAVVFFSFLFFWFNQPATLLYSHSSNPWAGKMCRVWKGDSQLSIYMQNKPWAGELSLQLWSTSPASNPGALWGRELPVGIFFPPNLLSKTNLSPLSQSQIRFKSKIIRSIVAMTTSGWWSVERRGGEGGNSRVIDEPKQQIIWTGALLKWGCLYARTLDCYFLSIIVHSLCAL